MDLSNKSFKDNQTGEIVKVIGSFENIAILENKQKVDVKRLMDVNFYTEQIDPSNFFNNQGAYNNLAEKIKSIPADKIRDDVSGEVSINIDGSSINNSFKPDMNEPVTFMTSEEDERAELAKKYEVNNNSKSINKQNEAFAKILGGDEELPKSTQLSKEEVQRVEVRREEPQQQYIQSKVEDPIITMFKNVKRVKEFSISLEIKNKIPRLDFIEMMEDSYNTSIIDFLASEFTDNLLKNPQIIEDMIKQKIKELVYGAEVGVKDVNPQITDAVTQIGQLKNDVSFNEETDEVKVEKPKTTRKTRPNPLKGEKGFVSRVKKEVSK
jgi:hypothetical protein